MSEPHDCKPHKAKHEENPKRIKYNWFCCGAMQLGLVADSECCDICGKDFREAEGETK